MYHNPQYDDKFNTPRHDAAVKRAIRMIDREHAVPPSCIETRAADAHTILYVDDDHIEYHVRRVNNVHIVECHILDDDEFHTLDENNVRRVTRDTNDPPLPDDA